MDRKEVIKNRKRYERKMVRFFAVQILAVCLVLSAVPCSVKAADNELHNPVINNGVTTWDCIWFGNYYQSSSDKKEPVKWRVLHVSGGDALLLADVNLDCQPYHDTYDYITWEGCSLRKWLNNDFMNTAFTSAERAAIKTVTNETEISPYANFTEAYGGNDTEDRIFCLAWEDLVNPAYGFPADTNKADARIARNSDYTVEKGVLVAKAAGYEGNSWWWLRTPGYYNKSASFISHDGAFPVFTGESGGVAVTSSFPGVRPALHINLSKAVWSKAGQVTSEDKESTLKSDDDGQEVSADPAVKETVTKNKVYTISGMKYKVTNADMNGKGTVMLTGTTTKKSKLKKLTVPATVKISGAVFKVNAIGKQAFRKYTKLGTVVVGKNVAVIGAGAFEGDTALGKVTIGESVTKLEKNVFSGDKKLKTIKIKSAKLKSVGRNAIKSIDKSAVIAVPKKQLKKYKKLFSSGTGFKKTMKIK